MPSMLFALLIADLTVILRTNLAAVLCSLLDAFVCAGIAHRLQTVIGMDKIAVISEGKGSLVPSQLGSCTVL